MKSSNLLSLFTILFSTAASNIHPGGKCGSVNGVIYNCGEKECCSEYGYCGSTSKHCNMKSVLNPYKGSAPTLPINFDPPIGQCGIINGVELACGPDECCSQYGWCGKSKNHCNERQIKTNSNSRKKL